MKTFEVKTFNIPTLTGISEKTIEEHLKLYAGYVKHTNLILEQIQELKKDADPSTPLGAGNAYALGEINRRLGFEYNGMRNHEVYFESLAEGPTPLSDGPLKNKITETWGSYDAWLIEFKAIASTRGVGWAMLYYDKKDDRLLNAWVDEQHLGQLQGCDLILGLDMWEHSFVADYQPSGKKQYIEDYFTNLNWENIERNFTKAQD
ncbi:MAG: superoxide dismutase [Candidatus Zambryskibacteria bacterium CG10_big_fil_rev_8_21_14_0_10_42_12]|uniref:superoxide dismutase n=1 Tax=Candidatus Zambryskibacteria bacterium CG10_big_fil_rev_8_21_14_0_10_42_12 TaxID=1975115 RepID=A0A2H0QYW7_9BACT|nr:MAG: superoxide dismutase [Candidatus Zambryskibacteria bacterium CG10_big_fil_rev_8_21_14_0_10_42_12]